MRLKCFYDCDHNKGGYCQKIEELTLLVGSPCPTLPYPRYESEVRCSVTKVGKDD